MIPGRYNLSIQAGETVNRQFKILTANGNPYDLTGYTIQSFIKPDYTASSAAATFTCTSPSPTDGIINLALASGSSVLLTSSCYYYDVRITSASNALYPLEGKVIVSPSITK
jgi:energy-converting hydrogenase Eha subunit C